MGADGTTIDLVRTLYLISADYEAGFGSQMERLLAAGTKRLDVEIGLLAQVEGPDYFVRAACSPEDAIAVGTRFDLARTYCEATLKADGPLGFANAKGSRWHDHPCYADFKLEAYMGTPVRVRDQVWGTLNFSSPNAREREWTEEDVDAVQLMATWVGGELYRQAVEAQLRKALAEVDTLRGLLPICAGCKKIRERSTDDGEERWTPVEAYVGSRTDAEFSHGMCPACARERYSDLFPPE